MTTARRAQIVHVDEAAEIPFTHGNAWVSHDKRLSPPTGRTPGRLGVVLCRVPPGKSGCPFHTHQREDEVFFVLSGRGVLRYGDDVREVGAGDCITCPAGTGIAHPLANPFDTDLRYLTIGMNDPDEVCTYPDSGQIMVRSLGRNGFLHEADYFVGQPEPPRIMVMRAGRAPD